MRITPADILYYSYCPYLLHKDTGKTKLLGDLDLFNKCLFESIIDTERKCLLTDSDVTPRKLLRSWDTIWWPAAVENEIPLKVVEEECVRASKFMSDYCNYEISGFMYPTVGVKITTQREIENCTLHSSVDMIKVDLNNREKNAVIIDFATRELSEREIAIDMYNIAKSYSFYSNKGETITYVHIKPKRDRFFISSAIFRPSQMKEIDKVIKHLAYGIYNNIRYMNRWNCKECGACKTFKF